MSDLISMKALIGGLVQKNSKKFFRDHTYLLTEKLPSRDSYQCTLTCHGCGLCCVIRFLTRAEPMSVSVAAVADMFCSLCKKLDQVQVEVSDGTVPDGQLPRTSDANEVE